MQALSQANEDYLKAIYGLRSRGEHVSIGQLAIELKVSSPSVTGMVKRLEAGHLVSRPDSRSLRLTAKGEQEALRVVRRHRLLETFLFSVLGVPWDEVHAEADRLEHVLSGRLEERIDAYLGHPTHDPHGDPIPPRTGRHDERWGQRLDAAAADTDFVVERVSDRDSAALRYLGELGVRPGARLRVEEQAPFGGPRWIRVEGGERRPFGAALTRLVHGRVEPGPAG